MDDPKPDSMARNRPKVATTASSNKSNNQKPFESIDLDGLVAAS